MDFNRGSRPSHTQTSNTTSETARTFAAPSSRSSKKDSSGSMGLRIASVVILTLTAIVVLAIILLSVLQSNKDDKTTQSLSNLKTDQYQAVFLTNGQVYFGKLAASNKDAVSLSDIYYLTPDQTVQPNTSQQTTQTPNYTLIKLGCELHGPEDNMVISRDQVSFWENLKTDGKVAKGITEFQKQNPDGLKCDQAAQPQTTN